MDASHQKPQLTSTHWSRLDAASLIGLCLSLLVILLIDRFQTSSPLNAPVDLVFVIDQRFEMKDLLGSVKTNCIEKARSLSASGAKCRIGTIPFGGSRSRFATIPLTSDIGSFEKQLMASETESPHPYPKTGRDAIQQALSLEFRQEASVILFLISKTPFADDDEISSIGKDIEERGIAAIVQADSSQKNRSRPLYQSGGRFYSMEGDDLTDPGITDKHRATRGKPQTQTANLLARLSPDKAQSSSGIGQVKGIFSLRTALNRTELVERLGGSHASELAVQSGLDWLARHQADDGRWSDATKCEKDHICDVMHYRNRATPIAETGLAILAFQAGGTYDFNDHKYSDNVLRGLEWLVINQRDDGCLFGDAPMHTWYEHGIAVFALAEACAVAAANDEQPNPRFRDAAARGIKFIEDHQYSRGGWQYALNSPSMGDSSVTGWQMLALKSGMEAGIEVSPQTIARMKDFFEGLGNPATGQTGYQSRGHGTDLTTAVGLIFQEFVLKQPHSPFAEKAATYLKTRAPQVTNSGSYYAIYNCTLAMFLAKGDAWQVWNGIVRDAVINEQSKVGCTRGSWNGTYGRTLSTAWAILTLEVYYRYASEE